VAAATWAVLGGASLAGEAAALAGALEDGDLAAARARIPNLCGRDPDALDAAGMARAAAESVAENTSDAVVGRCSGVRWPECPACSVPCGEHAGRHGRLPLAPVPPVRLGGRADRRTWPTCSPPGSPRSSPCSSPRRWRLAGGCRASLAARRRRHPSPNAGPVEASAAAPWHQARRAHAVPTRRGAAPVLGAGRRPHRPTCGGWCGCPGCSAGPPPGWPPCSPSCSPGATARLA